ncbi:MAG: DUF2156 domain-containing protein [Oscillospiraceae bacterium]|nr:DUF2156 domain-containing protein [Oscillospiraceae bacterium]
MLEFEPVKIDDVDWASQLLENSGNSGCEFNFANNLAWSRTYNLKRCSFDGLYILSAGENETLRFMLPVGNGDFKSAFSEMKKYSESFSKPLEIYGITDATMPFVRAHFDDRFRVTEDRDSFDYIYLSEKMVSLSGKKLHSKRNHLKRFETNYDFSYNEICERDFDDCIAFAAQSYNENLSYDDESAVGEQYAIHTYFEHFDRLKMHGGVLRIDGKVRAFTLGSAINTSVCDINIEKADRSFEGSYTAICNSFAKSYGCNFKYINREEDLGLEGLRKSKLSYCPEFLLKKYRVIIDG